MTKIVEVKNLHKNFRIRTNSGTGFSFRSLCLPQYEIRKAIDNLTFSIRKGEKVAFLGANGAGKSTVIKMLTGILTPTAGDILIENLVPWKQRTQLAHRIGIIFGQRSQLWAHLPAKDAYKLISHIYGLSKSQYNHRLAEITQVLDLDNLIDTPVRQLSLGQRMRCEIGATLLHKPPILFLDEPTIGIDINSKLAIRDYLNYLSEREDTTIFMTSHDIGDVDHVCDRVIILNEGKKTIDENIDFLKERHLSIKRIKVKIEEDKIDLKLPGLKILECSPQLALLEVDTKLNSVKSVISEIFSSYTVYDISVLNPPLEGIISSLLKNESIQ